METFFWFEVSLSMDSFDFYMKIYDEMKHDLYKGWTDNLDKLISIIAESLHMRGFLMMTKIQTWYLKNYTISINSDFLEKFQKKYV